MVEIDISPTKDMILDLSSKEDGELQEAKVSFMLMVTTRVHDIVYNIIIEGRESIPL